MLGVVGLSSVKWKWRLWWGSRGYGGVMGEWVTSRGVTSHTGGQQRLEKMPALGLGPARLYRVATLLKLASHFFRSLVCVCVREGERETCVCVCFSVWGRWVWVWERKRGGGVRGWGGGGGGRRTWEKRGRDRGILTKVKLCLLILCDISRHATLINSAQLV